MAARAVFDRRSFLDAIELQTIIDLISSPSFAERVAILGPGSVGKTALAFAVLTHEEVVSRFGKSRYLIRCQSIMSRDALLVAIANSLSLFRHGWAQTQHLRSGARVSRTVRLTIRRMYSVLGQL